MNCKNCDNPLPKTAKFCSKCGKSIDAQGGSKIEFFAVSPKRLALLSILTFGIYETYWFYKNWEAIKESEGREISPFWRTVFAFFYCNSLFKKVLESAKNQGYQSSYSPGWLTVAYFSIFVISNALSRAESSDVGFNLIWLIVASATFIPLLSVQKAINFNNEKIKGDTILRQEFSSSEVILIVIGAILLLLVLEGIFFP